MADCKIYDDKILIAYLQNRMDREEMNRLQFHLLQCDKCRERLENLRNLADFMDYEEEEIGVPDIASPEDKERSGNRGMVFRMAASVALLIGLSLGGYYLFSPGGLNPSINNPGPKGNNGQKDSTYIPPADSLDILKKDTVFQIDSIMGIVIEE